MVGHLNRFWPWREILKSLFFINARSISQGGGGGEPEVFTDNYLVTFSSISLSIFKDVFLAFSSLRA